jgi:hypothetical protein
VQVSGTRVTLDTVVAAFNQGATPEEIASGIHLCSDAMSRVRSPSIWDISRRLRRTYSNGNNTQMKFASRMRQSWSLVCAIASSKIEGVYNDSGIFTENLYLKSIAIDYRPCHGINLEIRSGISRLGGTDLDFIFSLGNTFWSVFVYLMGFIYSSFSSPSSI